MRAVVFEHHGDPARTLFLTELPLPDTPSGTARVRLLSRPVNPSDVMFVKGEYGREARFVPVESRGPVSPVGFEGAGYVDQVGPGVSLQPGSRVAVAVTGTWQEYVTAPLDAVVPLPHDLPLDAACQFTVNPFTAHLLLADLRLEAGDTLLLTAGTSTVGQMLMCLAHHRGIRCICLARDSEQATRLEKLGVELVVSAQDHAATDEVRNLAGSSGVAAALDAVGGQQGALALKCVRDGGRHVVYGSMTGRPFPVPTDAPLFHGVTIEGFWLPRHMEKLSARALRELTSTVTRQLVDHTLATPVEARYDLADVHRAYAHHARSGRSGKIVLTG
ncbi:zinc-dependent alcohol dehydrogenase family protein [Streptomyces sp. TRM 70351]|uniref:zinc-dependent alcohol dehydrogenase family protein n=1 Tax=Streptomyces sp. TRM 70351 TaxID=3116552 RepID=UPI002E7AD7F8|nr:zinc-dependent alcohol dehydrogenase family protein [Streptomyces sp. TRM 70351]MEE1928831.1 zinc-dependent alcohol dehydrogenase family protein [Streptomyces sp. TRM 70351]